MKGSLRKRLERALELLGALDATEMTIAAHGWPRSVHRRRLVRVIEPTTGQLTAMRRLLRRMVKSGAVVPAGKRGRKRLYQLPDYKPTWWSLNRDRVRERVQGLARERYHNDPDFRERQRAASRDCARRARAERALRNPPQERKCRHCGKTWVWAKDNQRTKFCSDKCAGTFERYCRVPTKHLLCTVCGESFESRTKRLLCFNLECTAEDRRRRSRQYQANKRALNPRRCEICHDLLHAKSKRKFCSTECTAKGVRLWQKQWRKNTPKGRAYMARKQEDQRQATAALNAFKELGII